jgi:DNA (cytosine-5)-methyltransferase 1
VIGRKPGNGGNGVGADDTGVMYTLTKTDIHAVAFAQNQRDEVRVMQVAGALAAEPGAKQQTYAQIGMAVRRLTPTECERLQGFPDGYTDIRPGGKPTPDGPRYKALGNSMAIPPMRWLGQRIALVDSIQALQVAA